MQHTNSLSKAIELVGLRQLAARVGVTYQAIQKFQKTEISSERVLAISAATDYQVTPHQLRPDIYPHPSDGLPENLRLTAARSHDESVRAE
jgi:DNA-binding transcriptional regulator YdaS (Cro superfamily)